MRLRRTVLTFGSYVRSSVAAWLTLLCQRRPLPRPWHIEPSRRSGTSYQVADECGGASPTTKRSLTLAPASPLISRLERIFSSRQSPTSHWWLSEQRCRLGQVKTKRTRLMDPGKQLSEPVGSGMGRRGFDLRATIATASSAIIFAAKIGRLMMIDGPAVPFRHGAGQRAGALNRAGFRERRCGRARP
jgi:hypothetical protein